MSARRRGAAVAICLLLSVTAGPAVPAPARVVRVAGSDRIATAVAAAHAGGDADDALLASARGWADALGAAALAGRRDAPLLLTEPDRLPAAVLDAIEDLGVERVTVLGGTQAVGPAVVAALLDAGVEVERIAGPDRWATAAALALAAGPSPTGEVVVALGEHPDPAKGWPDALAGAGLAAGPERVPLVLARADGLPAAARDAVRSLGASTALLLGGPGTIGAGVEAELRDLGLRVRRLSGPTRYDTAASVAAIALERLPQGAPLVVAPGIAFPDALAAGAPAARSGAALVLAPPDVVPGAVRAVVARRGWPSALAVGGRTTIHGVLLPQLAAATEDAPVIRTVEGRSTWYGPGLEGNGQACGGIFDSSRLVAAHRTLPCGTRLRVEDVHNGRIVLVTVEDRGPFDEDLELDLSAGAADVLDLRRRGTTDVRIEVLGG